jgi:Fusaric acid resistance protein-like
MVRFTGAEGTGAHARSVHPGWPSPGSWTGWTRRSHDAVAFAIVCSLTAVGRRICIPEPGSADMLRSDHCSASGRRLAATLDRLDPGTHRRIKGLRLVTAFGLAAMLATVPGIAHGRGMLLGTLAAGFALWASVSEARSTRYESARDLTLLCLATGIGAASFATLARWLGSGWAELTLVSGCFCVGYLKRFGVLGGGIGSQVFIGQLLAYGATVVIADLGIVTLAVALAILASVVPRTLSGPAEQPASAVQSLENENDTLTPEFVMGLQAAVAALAIVMLGKFVGLTQSAWAIAACTYVVANTTAGTIDRIKRRIAGTLVGVPLALACLPFAPQMPLLIWAVAAIAMIIYAMALPERYDIACGAYAFALVVTMAATGEYTLATLAARAWETLIGGALGVAVVLLLEPLPRFLRGRYDRAATQTDQ